MNVVEITRGARNPGCVGSMETIGSGNALDVAWCDGRTGNTHSGRRYSALIIRRYPGPPLGDVSADEPATEDAHRPDRRRRNDSRHLSRPNSTIGSPGLWTVSPISHSYR